VAAGSRLALLHANYRRDVLVMRKAALRDFTAMSSRCIHQNRPEVDGITPCWAR